MRVGTRFTIAIPTHNRAETAVLAVRSTLAQTRAPTQVIVLCDGCEDGTAGAVRALGSPLVDVLELPKGPGYGYGHRNRALDNARGDVIIWLADDDLLLPDHLERIGTLWDLGRCDIVQSDGVVVREDDSLEFFGSDWSLQQGRRRLEATNTNPMSAISVRVDAARGAGGWDASEPRAGDWDLWRRCVAGGARSARSLEMTVLHFRASGREQPWADRVRQNEAFFNRLDDAAALGELRRAMVSARSAWEADLIERLSASEPVIAALHDRLASSEARAATYAETLNRIYAGRWWGMRRRLAPLIALAYRGRLAVRSRL